MAKTDELVVVVRYETEQASRDVDKVQRATDRMGKSAKLAGGSLLSMLAGAGLAAGAAVATAAAMPYASGISGVVSGAMGMWGRVGAAYLPGVGGLNRAAGVLQAGGAVEQRLSPLASAMGMAGHIDDATLRNMIKTFLPLERGAAQGRARLTELVGEAEATDVKDVFSGSIGAVRELRRINEMLGRLPSDIARAIIGARLGF